METEHMVKRLTESGCLVEPEAVDAMAEEDLKRITSMQPRPMVITERFLENLHEHREGSGRRTKVEVEKSFEGNMEEKDVEEFVQYYHDRYERMKELLTQRMELSNAVSIGRLDDRGEREDVSIIGMVRDMYKTSNSGKWIVYLEDPSGSTKVLVDEDEGEWIVEDEVLGVSGQTGDDIVFADSVIRPDIPLSRDVRTTDEEVYAAFISDIHYGSIDTLDERMDTFAEWLRSGAEEADKVNYLFVNGDIAEGVGNYPGQKDELVVTDIYKQYERFEAFIEKVPDDIAVIVVPGNHDFVRLAEPQPPFSEETLPSLVEKDNVYLLSNPATVKIHGFDTEGIRVLLYHGYSFDNHVDAIPDLREKGYEEPHHAMVDYLKRRHLAPTYGSNLLSPEERDYMVIDEVPDIFVMGHTHAFDVENYKTVNLISSGTMQSQTDFQKRMGHKPDPGKIALINIKTRDTIVKEV